MTKPSLAVRVVGSSVILIVLATAYCWTAKKSLLTGTRRYVGANGAVEIHEFGLLEYRFRPILVWRAQTSGAHIYQMQRTFGAWTIEALGASRWCNRGVYVKGLARYDYGDAQPLVVFYDFESDALRSTLDGRTTVEGVENAARGCAAK